MSDERQEFKRINLDPNISISASSFSNIKRIKEVKDICEQPKNNRTPGPGNIQAEIVKYITEKL